MVTTTDIAQRVRTTRLEQGLTIEQLAEKADVSAGTIATFERNTNLNIGLDKLVRLANVLNLNADELLKLNGGSDVATKKAVEAMLEKVPSNKRERTLNLVAEMIDLVAD